MQSEDFGKVLALCMMVDFANGLISLIFRVFRAVFLHRTTKWFVEWILPYFLEFEFLTQSRILQVCKSGVVYARTRFFQYFFKSRNRKCSFFRLPGNLIARLHLTLSKTSENYENMAFRGRPGSDCTSNFLRADSQRGAAESTIARKKRGRVV